MCDPLVVGDDEIVFRSVEFDDGKKKPTKYYAEGGQVFLKEDTFYPKDEISVNRSCCCDNDPINALQRPRDGVVALLAKEIRKITAMEQLKQFEVLAECKVDVVGQPNDQCGHAVIIMSPSSNRILKKIQIGLVLLSTWRLYPEGHRHLSLPN